MRRTRRIITYGGLLMASLVIIGMFVTATNYLQLAVAVVFYPLFVYLVFRLFPYRIPKAHQCQPLTPLLQPVSLPESKMGIADIKRRDFLKLIGAAGLSFFLFSLFSKKGEMSFIGEITGRKVASSPDAESGKMGVGATADYQISEVDEGAVAYYGFINKKGAWFIMKEDSETGSFRYSRGDSEFSKNWANRQSLNYDYYYKVF
jgi:hypothetical protein